MADFDPGQREHELADALVTLIIAVSRYGGSARKPRDTKARLATLQHVTILVADGVAERVGAIGGRRAAAAFRARLSNNGEPK